MHTIAMHILGGNILQLSQPLTHSLDDKSIEDVVEDKEYAVTNYMRP